MYLPKLFVIPTPLMQDNRLHPLDWKIYGLVYWFTKLELKRCILKNENIAELLECSLQSVKDSVSRLVKYDCLLSVYDRRTHIRELVPVATEDDVEQVVKKRLARYSKKDVAGSFLTTEDEYSLNQGNKRNIKRELEEEKNNENGLLYSRSPLRARLRTDLEDTDKNYYNRIIQYYLEIYKETMGIEHPELKPDQLRRILDVITSFDQEWTMELNDWGRMILHWFNTNVESDRNLNHFATYGILQNRYNEVIR